MSFSERVQRVVQAIADGEPIDWPAELRAAESHEDRILVEALQRLWAVTCATSGHGAETSASAAVGDPSSPVVVPSTWGSFTLLEALGHGAYGTVYRAHDRKLDRDVALKLLADEASPTTGGFIEEGRILARLRHPNIVSVYGAESHDGQDGVWMELVIGRTYDDIVRRDGPFGARETALVVADLCRAVAAVHATGLVHRDITARNVMREAGGRVVLLDFSAGRRWSLEDDRAGVAGTPLYLPPEVLVSGAGPTVSGDIYSIGVLLFFLTTGTHPVTGASIADLRARHAAGSRQSLQAVRPDLPATFAAVVERALDADPSQRPGTALELAHALLQTLDARFAPTADSSEATATARWRRPVPAWAAALATLGAVAITLFATIRSEPQPDLIAGGPPTLSSDQWPILTGYLDLADEAGERGAWAEAAGLYGRAAALISDSLGTDDEPIRAFTIARQAWALSQAGDTRAAHNWNDLAIYKIVQEAGSDHPLLVTFELAKAAIFGREGRTDDAAAALGRAVEHHQGLLVGVGVAVRGVPAPVSADAIPAGAVCDDADGDWVLDVFERAVGLDPTIADSDANGITDDEEDQDRDGVPNGVAWPYGCDPRRVVVHHGALDPLRAGFRKERQFVAHAAPLDRAIGPAWRVDSPMGFYYWRLTNAQKDAALTRGWRMRARLALRDGNGFVDLDLAPNAGRFDLGFFGRNGATTSFLLMESSQPRKGEWLGQVPTGAMPLVEFVSDPVHGTVRFLVNGRTVRSGYPGYRQFQEDFGLFFGATSDLGGVPSGQVDIALAWLAIR